MSTTMCSDGGNWSNVKTCLFIDLYKERPYLWNPKHSEYKNKLTRFDGLTEISNIMKISIEECEKKIKNLLSQYSREKKKLQHENKSGAGANAVKNQWFAFEQMQFLQDRNKPIHTRDTGDDETSIVLVHENSITSSDLTTPIIQESDTADIINSKTPCLIKTPIEINTKSKKKRMSTENEEMRKKAFKILENVYEDRGTKDEFTLLGEEVAMQVRNLKTPYARSTVKFKIQKLLYEATLGNYDAPQINYQGSQNLQSQQSTQHDIQEPTQPYHLLDQLWDQTSTADTQSDKYSADINQILTHL